MVKEELAKIRYELDNCDSYKRPGYVSTIKMDSMGCYQIIYEKLIDLSHLVWERKSNICVYDVKANKSVIQNGIIYEAEAIIDTPYGDTVELKFQEYNFILNKVYISILSTKPLYESGVRRVKVILHANSDQYTEIDQIEKLQPKIVLKSYINGTIDSDYDKIIKRPRNQNSRTSIEFIDKRYWRRKERRKWYKPGVYILEYDVNDIDDGEEINWAYFMDPKGNVYRMDIDKNRISLQLNNARHRNGKLIIRYKKENK